MLWCSLVLVLLLPSLSAGQQASAPPAPDLEAVSLSQDRIRQLIRESADNDLENDKKLRNYTYTEHDVERHLDGKGQVKSTESKTYEVMELYGDQVQKLIAKDDKPLSEKEARKEEERIQKLMEKRKNESEHDRKKRLEKEEKDREDERKFVTEVADAYSFRLVGVETLDGRPAYVIDAAPKPGYQPHSKEAKILPKVYFRAWIDKDEAQWKKLDVQCLDTVSFGLFLVRIHKGSHIVIEQTRVNNEVWLPQHVAVNADIRLALVKTFDIALDNTYSNYRKFRAEAKIVSVGEIPGKQ
jgi:hypothetical protein